MLRDPTGKSAVQVLVYESSDRFDSPLVIRYYGCISIIKCYLSSTTMKIRRNNPRKKSLFVSLAAITLLVIGYLAYAYAAHSWPWPPRVDSQSGQLDPDETSDKSTDASDETIDKPSSKGPGKTPLQYEVNPDTKNEVSQLSGVINYKAVSNNSLSIRVTIDQKLDEGSCSLTLTRRSDGKIVQKSAEVFLNPSSTSCKGFDIPTSELGKGSWDIDISIKSRDSKGTIKGSVAI